MKRRQFIQSCAALVAAPILPAVLPEPILPKRKTRIYDGGLGSVGILPQKMTGKQELENLLLMYDRGLISNETLADTINGSIEIPFYG